MYGPAYDAGDTKDDKVFLLSREDVLNESYGFNSGDGDDIKRVAFGTDYAKCQGLWVSPSTEDYYCDASYWRLRTPNASFNTPDVADYGFISDDLTGNACGGVRAALNINLQAAISEGLIRITQSSAPTEPVDHPVDENVYNLGEETYSFKNYGDLFSPGGHCFGMSMTSSGYYLGSLDFSIIDGDDNSKLYSFSDTQKVKEPICFYQDIQGSFSKRAIVAGGSHYLRDKYDIASDWQQVIEYVRDHEYDNTGKLQIGFRKKGKGGHAINFLRYENVGGQDRIYAYDNNFPTQETYFYQSSTGKVYQKPVSTFGGPIDCIALRDVAKYFNNAVNYDASRVIYSKAVAVIIGGVSAYLMDMDPDGEEYVMYEIPAEQKQVIITPLVDNAEFVYMGTTYSFGVIDDDTEGEFVLSETNDYRSYTSPDFIIKNAPSQTPEPQIMPGDVNGDGKVLANDARTVLRVSAKLESLDDAGLRTAADVNEDGQILADDARQILRYSAKLISEFTKKAGS